MLRSRLEYKTYKQVRSMDLKLKEQHKARRKAWFEKMLLRLNSSGRLRQKLKPLKLSHIIWSDEQLFRCRKTSKSGQNLRWRQQEACGEGQAGCCHHGPRRPESRQHGPHVTCVSLMGGHALHLSGCHLLRRSTARSTWPSSSGVCCCSWLAVTGCAEPSECELQQDNAPSHLSAATQKFLKEQGVTVLQFPANSPDLNPLDYFLWGAIDGKLKSRYDSIPSLQAAVIAECAAIKQESADKAIEQFKRRCVLCVEQDGGSFGHLLK